MGRNQPLKIDTYEISNLPFSMRVSLTANQFHPIKKETKEMSVNSYKECKVDPNEIREIRKDKNCTDDCIPTIFSSLFNMSTFKECPDYESHFCALEDLFLYNFVQVNLFQKHFFFHQLTHSLTKDCSLNYEFST